MNANNYNIMTLYIHLAGTFVMPSTVQETALNRLKVLSVRHDYRFIQEVRTGL